MTLSELLNYFLHPQPHLQAMTQWMGAWFYLMLFAIIFCETGLVVTPFLPGDSLLFAVGALASANSALSMPLLFTLLIIAAVVGDAVNYAIGYWLGPKVFKYEQSWFLNRKHLLRAQAFYEKYGSKTIILARFVPIVRTFAPFVAGIGKMRYPRFFLYNCVGAVAWVAICLWSGYFFGEMAWVKQHFELVVLAIVFISVLPMAIEYLLAWRRRRLLTMTVQVVEEVLEQKKKLQQDEPPVDEDRASRRGGPSDQLGGRHTPAIVTRPDSRITR